jgi:hypothetical protein
MDDELQTRTQNPNANDRSDSVASRLLLRVPLFSLCGYGASIAVPFMWAWLWSRITHELGLGLIAFVLPFALVSVIVGLGACVGVGVLVEHLVGRIRGDGLRKILELSVSLPWFYVLARNPPDPLRREGLACIAGALLGVAVSLRRLRAHHE